MDNKNKIKKCIKCGKIIRSQNKSGLCTKHYHKNYDKEYGKIYRQKPDVKERLKINQKNFRLKRNELKYG